MTTSVRLQVFADGLTRSCIPGPAYRSQLFLNESGIKEGPLPLDSHAGAGQSFKGARVVDLQPNLVQGTKSSVMHLLDVRGGETCLFGQ